MTAMHRALLLLAFLPLIALAPAPRAQEAAAQEAAACDAPSELLEAGALPALAKGIAERNLRILVVGSASVRGPGTSLPSAAWPNRLEALLEERLPAEVKVTVTTRGGRGLTTAEALPILAEELARPPRPHLVIWQTGTIEAARRQPVNEWLETLEQGLDQLREAGADVMLVDSQFSRFLRANADVEPYLDAMRLVAAANGAALLRRYDLMRHWAESEIVDLERTPRAQRTAAADKLHECVARAAVELILRGAAASASASSR